MEEPDTGYRRENYRLRRKLVRKNEEIERLQRLVSHYEIVVKNHEQAHARFRAALREITEVDTGNDVEMDAYLMSRIAQEALG